MAVLGGGDLALEDKSEERPMRDSKQTMISAESGRIQGLGFSTLPSYKPFITPHNRKGRELAQWHDKYLN